MPRTKESVEPTVAPAPPERITDDELRTLRAFAVAHALAEQELRFAERTRNDYAAVLAGKYGFVAGEQVNGDGTIARVPRDVAEGGEA